MQRVIRKKFSGHTIIAVAHKLETILDFDKIAVLDHGRLVEFASPDELLSRPSAFRRLYNRSQADEPTDIEPDDSPIVSNRSSEDNLSEAMKNKESK